MDAAGRKLFSVRNADNGSTLAPRAKVAAGIVDRFLGLMGRQGISEGGGLLLKRSSSIHSFFMRFRFDAIFLDADSRVVKVVPAMKPWRIAFGGRGAKDTLELPAGTAEATSTVPGHMLAFEEPA